MPQKRESDMYLPVKKYFKTELDCKTVLADLPDEKKNIQLLRNLSKRNPDVIGVDSGGDIHVAEGKILKRSGQPFEECVSQVMSLKAYADHLYVFFPEDEWKELAKGDVERNKRELRERGIGLLLVNGKSKCVHVLSAPQNKDAEKSQKAEVCRILGIDKNDGIPLINSLSAVDAANANLMLCSIYNVGTKIVREVFKKVFKSKKGRLEFGSYFNTRPDGSRYDEIFRTTTYVDDGSLGIEFDPFGAYLKDGPPCIWVWRKTEGDVLSMRIKNETFGFGTHLFLDDFSEAIHIFDLTDDRITKCIEKNGEFWLGHKVEFFGRSQEGLKRELTELLIAAKSLK